MALWVASSSAGSGKIYCNSCHYPKVKINLWVQAVILILLWVCKKYDIGHEKVFMP